MNNYIYSILLFNILTTVISTPTTTPASYYLRNETEYEYDYNGTGVIYDYSNSVISDGNAILLLLLTPILSLFTCCFCCGSKTCFTCCIGCMGLAS